QQTFIRLINCLPGEIRPVEYFAFTVYFIFGCINVFGSPVIFTNDAGAKTYNFTSLVVYGKGDAAPVIINQLVISHYYQSRFLQIVWIVLPCHSSFCKTVSLLAAIADLKFFYNRCIKPPFF